jgi:hypothetical protein
MSTTVCKVLATLAVVLIANSKFIHLNLRVITFRIGVRESKFSMIMKKFENVFVMRRTLNSSVLKCCQQHMRQLRNKHIKNKVQSWHCAIYGL